MDKKTDEDVAAESVAAIDVEGIKALADDMADRFSCLVHEYFDGRFRSDMEDNIKIHISNSVESVVEHLLAGNRPHLEKYVLKSYRDDVREAVARHLGDELAKARIADLEREVEMLRAWRDR